VSFILDAIAKSERERQQQEVPDARALAMPVDSAQRPRRVFPYLVLVALLLNVIVLVIWMQSGRSLPDWFSLSQSDAILESGDQVFSSEDSSTPEQIDPLEATDTVAVSKSAVEIEQSASKPTTADTASSDLSALPGKMESTSESLIEAGDETTSERPETVAGLEGETGLAASPGGSGTKSAEGVAWVRVEPDALTGSASPGEFANQSPGSQGADEVTPRKVSRLSELPADVRRDLPSVNFSGHLYSANPKLSYVFVNDGRSVFEGQQIASEVLLHEITPTGVVLEFRGYLIDVGVLQNWNLN
jgi:general secretion pathway protein B